MKSSAADRPVLVIGVGSTLRRDDAAGREVAERIDACALEGVSVQVTTQLVPELAESIAAAGTVVFVDASVVVRDVAVEQVRPSVGPGGSHHATPGALLGLVEQLGGPAPQAYLVHVPAFDLTLGEGLSRPAASAVEHAVCVVGDLVASASAEGGTMGPMDEWDEVAEGWDDAPGTRIYAEGAYRSLLDVLDAPLAGMRVLDFGCGSGLLTGFLVGRAASIDGVDTSPRMRQVFESKIRERDWPGVAVHAEIPDGAVYDLIVCSSVLAFVEDHPATVGRLAGHLAPGGLLVHWDWERDEDEPEAGGLDRAVTRAALESAGLTVVRVGVGFEASVDGFVMSPLMGIARRPA